ncbi:hypothetical protein ABH935_001346 [Catenulispora sp. GAS73]
MSVIPALESALRDRSELACDERCQEMLSSWSKALAGQTLQVISGLSRRSYLSAATRTTRVQATTATMTSAANTTMALRAETCWVAMPRPTTGTVRPT